MKTKQRITALAAAIACLSPLLAQDDPTAADPIPPADLPEPNPDEPVVRPDGDNEAAQDPAPAPDPAPADPAPADPVAEEEDEATEEPPIPQDTEEKNTIEEKEDGGLNLNGTPVNDLFKYLAEEAAMGYLYNSRLAGPEFTVKGQIPPGPPKSQMEAVAQFLNLEIYEDNNIVYLLDQSQIGQLPSQEFTYQLRYLRPSDIEEIKQLIQPLLTPGTGVINFEPKTNTIVIIDTIKKIASVENLLARVDKAKGQVVIETKILRTNQASGRARGFDWSTSLGRPGVGNGVSFSVIDDLNDLFNLGEYTGLQVGAGGGAGGGGAAGGAGGQQQSVFGQAGQALNEITVDNGAGLVLSPVQFSSVLRALNDANLATQESNPTLITEDNEEAVLSIIDRVPIITQTQSTGLSAGLATEEVRYTIDESDPTIATDATNTREIGVTVSVTPTVLPDNTIRMKLRPRSAQITEQVQGTVPGVTFPRVQEATISTISRVPNKHTLLLGGFYNLVTTDQDNRVPILGEIPLINFLFRSESESNEQTSLVFAVTPTAYDPSNAAESDQVNNAGKSNLGVRDMRNYMDEDESGGNDDASSAKEQPVYRRSGAGTPLNNPYSRRR